MAKKKRTHKWVAATIILVILVEFDIGDTIFALYLLGYCIYSIYLPVSWSFGRKKSEKGGEQIVDSTQTKEIKQSTKKKVASKLQYDGNEVILFSYSLVNESSPIFKLLPYHPDTKPSVFIYMLTSVRPISAQVYTQDPSSVSEANKLVLG